MSPLTKGYCTDTSPIVSAVASLKHPHTIPTEKKKLSVSPHRLKLIFIFLIITLICFVSEIKWTGKLPHFMYLWHRELDAVLSSVT